MGLGLYQKSGTMPWNTKGYNTCVPIMIFHLLRHWVGVLCGNSDAILLQHPEDINREALLMHHIPNA